MNNQFVFISMNWFYLLVTTLLVIEVINVNEALNNREITPQNSWSMLDQLTFLQSKTSKNILIEDTGRKYNRRILDLNLRGGHESQAVNGPDSISDDLRWVYNTRSGSGKVKDLSSEVESSPSQERAISYKSSPEQSSEQGDIYSNAFGKGSAAGYNSGFGGNIASGPSSTQGLSFIYNVPLFYSGSKPGQGQVSGSKHGGSYGSGQENGIGGGYVEGEYGSDGGINHGSNFENKFEQSGRPGGEYEHGTPHVISTSNSAVEIGNRPFINSINGMGKYSQENRQGVAQSSEHFNFGGGSGGSQVSGNGGFFRPWPIFIGGHGSGAGSGHGSIQGSFSSQHQGNINISGSGGGFGSGAFGAGVGPTRNGY